MIHAAWFRVPRATKPIFHLRGRYPEKHEERKRYIHTQNLHAKDSYQQAAAQTLALRTTPKTALSTVKTRFPVSNPPPNDRLTKEPQPTEVRILTTKSKRHLSAQPSTRSRAHAVTRIVLVLTRPYDSSPFHGVGTGSVSGGCAGAISAAEGRPV